MKENYSVGVTFRVSCNVIVSAENETEAITASFNANLPSRDTWEYINDSFQVDDDDIVKGLDNDNYVADGEIQP